MTDQTELPRLQTEWTKDDAKMEIEGVLQQAKHDAIVLWLVRLQREYGTIEYARKSDASPQLWMTALNEVLDAEFERDETSILSYSELISLLSLHPAFASALPTHPAFAEAYADRLGRGIAF